MLFRRVTADHRSQPVLTIGEVHAENVGGWG